MEVHEAHFCSPHCCRIGTRLGCSFRLFPFTVNICSVLGEGTEGWASPLHLLRSPDMELVERWKQMAFGLCIEGILFPTAWFLGASINIMASWVCAALARRGHRKADWCGREGTRRQFWGMDGKCDKFSYCLFPCEPELLDSSCLNLFPKQDWRWITTKSINTNAALIFKKGKRLCKSVVS